MASVALILWLLSWFLPAGGEGANATKGWMLVLVGLNPFALIFMPLAFLAVFTNLVFIHQASRVARHKRTSPFAIRICLLINLALLLPGLLPSAPPVLAAPALSAAPWVWVTSFLLLLPAVHKNAA
jgi:hypothetical protein